MNDEALELSAEERDGAIVREFIPLALRTCSPNYYGSKVPKEAMYVALRNVIAAAELLDGLKKLMFYGKPVQPGLWDVLGVPRIAEVEAFNDIAPRQFKNILHGVVGKITEAGEAAECLLKALVTGDLDTTNLKEEVGDGLWYDALILDALDSNFTLEMLRVIAKLRKRFPEKYGDDLAINRDHDAERVVLENDVARELPGKQTSPEVSSLSARYWGMSLETFAELCASDIALVHANVVSIAASNVSQDEIAG